jgi:dephospho-CoA kinase
MAYIIGLTGNIACGKSTVLEMLRSVGAETVDADEVAHMVMAPEGPAYRRIIKAFGEGILTQGGEIDRYKLGQIVFADPDKLRVLEDIIHPAVTRFIAQKVWRSSEKVVVIDAIKLLESDITQFCDAIWVVTCSHEQQVRRLMETRNLSKSDAEMRIKAQPPQADKIAKANVVIDNSGSIEDTKRQVREAWNKVTENLEEE